jgi:quinol monooxygenase YgiN
MIIRLSRGRYAPALHADVTRRLDAAGATLIPAIKKLPGCLHYYAASDEASSTMINVSVWDSLAHAQAMASLAEMSALAVEFTKLGVEFERPIVNYPSLWEI